jgi:two-component system sensor histidine kinase KdpD
VDRLLANAVHDADHLARLIADVLDLKRLEAGVAPRREWTAVGEVAASVLDRCAPLLGDRTVRFDVPDTLPLAQLDPTLLERVLTSLIENVAVQTPAGAPFAVEACADGVGLRIAVSDAGPGIPASARERVFATYERLDPARPGLGLGLALARSAVEAQGGRIWVEESDAGGSRFVIVLPDVLPTRRTT